MLTFLFVLILWLGGLCLSARWCPFLAPAEHLLLGFTLGTVLGAHLLLVGAWACGMTPVVLWSVALGMLVLSAVWGRQSALSVLRSLSPPALSWRVLWLVTGAAFLLVLHRNILVETTAGWESHQAPYTDIMFHLSWVAQMAYAPTLPLDNPFFSGHVYPYHFMPDFFSAVLVVLGGSLRASMLWTDAAYSFCFFGLVVVAARRLTNRGASLTWPLVAFGGGVGLFLLAWEHPQPSDFLHELFSMPHPVDAMIDHYLFWPNLTRTMLLSARKGPALCLSLSTFLLLANRSYLMAGLLLAMLPLENVHVAVGMWIIGILCVTPLWRLLVLILPMLLVSPLIAACWWVPETRAAALFYRLPGWMFPSSWIGFWLRNLGLVFALAPLGWRGWTPAGRRLYAASWASFALANTFCLTSSPWDNLKVMLPWFVLSCIGAAAALDSLPIFPARRLVQGCAMLIACGSGAGSLIYNLGCQPLLLVEADGLQLGMFCRNHTPQTAVFVTEPQDVMTITAVSGRRVFAVHNGPNDQNQLPVKPRLAKMHHILRAEPDADLALNSLTVDYVLVNRSVNPRADACSETLRRLGCQAVFQVGPYQLWDVSREHRRR